MSELKHEITIAAAETPADSDFPDDDGLAAENPAADLPRRRPFRRRKSGKPRKRRLTLAVLPTMLTLGNAVCGMAAIATITSTTLPWDETERLFAAGVLIFGGMLFDALDGSAARLTNSSSQFGAQLDSLCDAITFGAAPAVIVWRINEGLPSRLAFAVGVMFTLCVLIRLARFNVETAEDDPHDGFEGLPSPAAAGTIAAFAIGLPDLKEFAERNFYAEWVNKIAASVLWASHYVVPVLAAVLAYLMVSRFRYPHIISQWTRGHRPPHQIGQGLIAVLSVFWLHWLTLPLLFCYFALAAPVTQWMRGGLDDSDADSVIDADATAPESTE